MPYSPKAASTPTYTTPNSNTNVQLAIQKKRSICSVFLCGIPCHRRHSKITLRHRYAFCFLYMLAHDCKQSRGIDARRYSMPPTALKINLATSLRVLFFYICSRMTASSRAAYIKKQPYGFRKVVFSFGAGGRTRTDTDD